MIVTPGFNPQIPPPPKTRFMVSLNLGTPNQYTTYCVIEEQDEPFELKVRDLDRFPLGTPLPDMLATLVDVLSTPELKGQARLVVDVTGVGLTTGRNIRRNADLRGLVSSVYTVTINSGDADAVNGKEYTVPKIDVAGVLRELFEYKQLRLSAGLKDVPTLIGELQNFTTKVRPTSPDLFSWRDGAHDDLVLAVGVGAWMAVKNKRKKIQFGFIDLGGGRSGLHYGRY